MNPTTAVILCAGAGSRLLPLTERMPKCLVEVEGRSILDRQLDALRAAGIGRAVVVGGYRYRQIAGHLVDRPGDVAVELVFNPFWAVASSIGSVWAARAHLGGPFCLLNGDTVFEPALIAAAVARTSAGVALLVERLRRPAADDMLVAAPGGRVQAVAKNLPVDTATHRSLGVVLCGGSGAGYLEALETVIASPGGLDRYHHNVIDRLARSSDVRAEEARAGAWQEIDSPEDIARWGGHEHPG